MRKILILMCALLGLGVSGALADTVTWTPGLSFNESTGGNFSTGWFTVVSPINGTLNSFTVNLGTGSGAGISRTDAYLAISRNLKSSTTGFSASDFVAISNESCTTTGSKITLTFNSDAVLNGGSTYYFYWVTKSAGVYTTVNQRYYLVSSTQMSVGSVGSTSASSSSNAMPFSATMTIADNKYYRIKALYPDGICYLYSNESNEDKIWKNTSAPSVTASRYVWKATLSTGLILQNVGSSRYIPKLTTGSYTGDKVNYLTATTTDDAEKFSLEDNNPGEQNQPGFIALKSTTAASDVWLNTATSGNAYVGSHDANPNKSGQFLFYQVKKVTFSLPVAVNGGDAVSTIYVAVDGSDSFTLPAGYLYSVDGAAEVSNTLAASAISAAGTSDMSITVNAEVINATANITNNKLYHIYTYNNGSTEGSTKYYLTSGGQLTSDEASAGQFLFNATTTNGYVPAGYAWKISNGNNRFTNRPSNAPGQTHLNTTSGNNRDTYEAQVFYLNGGKYAVRSTNFDGSGSQYVQNSYWTVVADITDDGVPDATYDDTEGTKHYVWQLEEIASVTFNLIYEGNTIATTGILDNSDGRYNGTCSGAASLPTDTWSNPYCSYSYSPTTITSETRTVNVTMTWEGPFTISSDYASATWTYLKLRGKYAKYDKDLTITSDVAYPLYSNKSDVRYTDEGLWAFVGNPIQGVRLFNKAAGSGKCIQWTTQPQMDVTSKGNAVYWKIGKLDGYGFLLNYGGFYLHDLGGNTPGKLGIWNGNGASTDPGSAFVVEDLDWRDKAVFAVQDYANTHTINVYFGTDETVYNATINTVKSYAGDFSEEMYNEIITSLNNGELLLYPATGNYIIKHPYDSSQQGANVYLAANASGIYLKTGIDASNIVRVENNNDGTLNLAFQGKYVGDAPSSYAQFPLVNDAVAFNFDVLDAGNIGLHHSEGTHVYLWHGNEADKAVRSWVGGNSGYKWQIEDIDEGLSVTLNNGGDGNYYATFCAPFSYTVGSGTKAYTLAQSGDWLIPTEVEGTVAAGTPVLLKGTSPTATLTVGTDWAAAPLTSTALTGTYLATTIDGATDYVLGINDGVVGFYHWDSNALAANRAYLDKSTAPGVKGFAINWDFTDGIDAMQVVNGQQTNDAAIYNLAGQRVQKAQKGIYIQNGKKMFVK